MTKDLARVYIASCWLTESYMNGLCNKRLSRMVAACRECMQAEEESCADFSSQELTGLQELFSMCFIHPRMSHPSGRTRPISCSDVSKTIEL